MGTARPFAIQADQRAEQEAEASAVGEAAPARQGAVGKVLPTTAVLPTIKVP